MIVNRANLQMAFTGYKAAFQKAFDSAPIDYQDLVLEVPSTTSQEAYPWLGQTTGFREWIGDRVIQALKQHNYFIVNKSFENTVGVPREAFEDDQYGVYAPMMSQLGQDAKEHPAELVYNMLKNGFTQKGYDGQFFFDTDHPVTNADGAEVSVSNFQGGGGIPWFIMDTSRYVKPMILQKRKDYNFVSMDTENNEAVFMRKEYRYGADARLNVGYALWQLAYASKQDLTEENFDAAITAMQNLKGDNGRSLNIRPTVLVVPPSYRKKALKLLEAEVLTGGETNVNKNLVKVKVTPWLA
ncbi:MAG TPA: Mu-like prophage major head subunit gpT family protein [Cellvibrio sp.]|nr:Mu-like prophage major head subunit gpT family protein [Cellvibrio sp.]